MMNIITSKDIDIINLLINNISLETLKDIDINNINNNNIDEYLYILYDSCKDYF